MLQNLDDSIFPLFLEISEYTPFGCNNNQTFIEIDSPKMLVEEYFSNTQIGNVQNWYDRKLEENNVYKKWLVDFPYPSALNHINQYMNTYSSSIYFEKYGTEQLIDELRANSRFLPINQTLYRGGSNLEIPEKWDIGSSIEWNVPRSTTLNIDTALTHAHADCADFSNFGQPNLNLTPILFVLRIASQSVRCYVFRYGSRNRKSIEKEVLLCPDIILTKMAEVIYGRVKVIYIDVT